MTKFITVVRNGIEETFTFPASYQHDDFLQAVKGLSHAPEKIEPISAGLMIHAMGKIHLCGESVTLHLPARKNETELYLKQILGV